MLAKDGPQAGDFVIDQFGRRSLFRAFRLIAADMGRVNVAQEQTAKVG